MATGEQCHGDGYQRVIVLRVADAGKRALPLLATNTRPTPVAPAAAESQPMSAPSRSVATDHDRVEQIPDRTRRAATEPLVTTQEAPGFYHVYSADSGVYAVDSEGGACECADSRYREPAGGCKHVRYIKFVTGDLEIPFEAVDVNPVLVRQWTAYHRDGPAGLGYPAEAGA